ncbi:MAG: [acyl-carrier-protein] S-malonyltransferase [Campylobacteraceae bacterium 4484_4]|nr:MAG: [acyl-carrier-protein] S-malonyltransferase [Campylobacteraceae bacterium 4484_4]
MKKIAFIFPGQGSQSIGMGKEFYESSEIAREMVEAAGERIKTDFAKLLFEENDLLEQTAYTQPAILLVSAIAHRLFENEMEIKPILSLGHSLGEFSALVSVGALDAIDGVGLVHQRGKLMQQACEGIDAGMMALIGLGDEKVEEITAKAREEGKKVWPANYNSDGQIVAAGIKSDLAALEPVFKEAGAKRALLLNMSVASHCPLLQPAVEPLRAELEERLQNEFTAPVVSNVTAQKYSTKSDAVSLLAEQLIKPVLYKQSIQSVENDVDLFIEFGGSVLKGLNRRNTKKPTLSITDMVTLEKVFEEIA